MKHSHSPIRPFDHSNIGRDLALPGKHADNLISDGSILLIGKFLPGIGAKTNKVNAIIPQSKAIATF